MQNVRNNTGQVLHVVMYVKGVRRTITVPSGQTVQCDFVDRSLAASLIARKHITVTDVPMPAAETPTIASPVSSDEASDSDSATTRRTRRQGPAPLSSEG